MHTGENETGPKKIMDFTRLSGILILPLHFYFFGYRFFYTYGYSTPITDRLLTSIATTGLFSSFAFSKWMALALLCISLLGVKGKKEENIYARRISLYIFMGAVLFWGSASINLPALYNLKGNIRKSWINIINPFRSLLVIGSPGSGKSWFVIQHVIKQHIEKGFAIFVYDFKYDDLTRIATIISGNTKRFLL